MLHFFCSKEDYMLLINYICCLDLVMSDDDEKQVNNNAFSFREIRFYENKQQCYEGNKYISIDPPRIDVNVPGIIMLNDEDKDSSLSNGYKKIKRYIKSNYLSELGYYIGGDFYKKWYDHEIEMNKMFLKSKRIDCVLNTITLTKLISFLKNKGYCITNKNIEAISIDHQRQPIKDILIFSRGAHLFSYQTALSIYGVGSFAGETYSTESEAVFAFFKKSNKGIQCRFIIDERWYDERNPNIKLIKLFSTIESYVNSIL